MPDEPSDDEIAEWVVRTCLLFGASVATAYSVASVFVAGLVDERSTPVSKEPAA